jgi:S-adenosyl-L-methionine hydrolase (adenosine-forming)
VTSRFDFVSFLSDYGRTDEFVGVCHGVMLDLAPHLRVVDVTHDVPAFDVRAGGLALARSVQYLPQGLVLAVVDPGVGTERRCLAVEVAHGVLVGPDNGLLAPAVALLGGPQRIVALQNEQYRLPAPGPTFAGRDIMAPAVAHIANGVPLGVLGDEVDPASVTPGILPLPNVEDGMVQAEVLWVDRFGNCQLNVDPDLLRELGVRPGESVELRIGESGRRARWAHTFADANPSELLVVVDSYGSCALAYDRRSAAAELKLRAGSTLTLAPQGAGS